MQGASHRHEIVGLVLPLLQESRPCLLELLENSESGNNIERTVSASAAGCDWTPSHR